MSNKLNEAVASVGKSLSLISAESKISVSVLSRVVRLERCGPDAALDLAEYLRSQGCEINAEDILREVRAAQEEASTNA